MFLALLVSCCAGSARERHTHWINRSTRCLISTCRRMSFADLRELQKSVAKAISTFEAQQKAEAREKVEMLAKELGFTLAELTALEEPKRKRAPSTKIYRHPENPALTWSGRGASRAGLPPMSMPAKIRTSSSAERAFAAPDQPGEGDPGLGQVDCVWWPWWRITLSELWVKEPNILKPIKYYCVDGTTQDAIPLTPNKAAFYRDAVGHWHMTGLDDVAATDSICVPVHEAIRMAVYTRQEYEDSKRILESSFIYDAEIDAEMKISKDDCEKALAANSLAKRELHQALYWQDYAFLLSNVQSGLSEIISTAGAFYEFILFLRVCWDLRKKNVTE